jgi:hypothetical protein
MLPAIESNPTLDRVTVAERPGVDGEPVMSGAVIGAPRGNPLSPCSATRWNAVI